MSAIHVDYVYAYVHAGSPSSFRVGAATAARHIQDIPERRREFLATTRNKIDLHT